MTGYTGSKNVTDDHISYLTRMANTSPSLSAGHTVRLRVATSHGRPVCAELDLYDGDTRLATAGRKKRLNFAIRSSTSEWLTRADKAVQHAYLNMLDAAVTRCLNR